MHLFLSPHSDDAALSCGGLIAQLTRSGERVVIFTMMAADPPLGFTSTPFTETLHKRWNLGPHPAEGRRKEDIAAAKMLGAEARFGPFPDAIYRLSISTNKPLYATPESIFETIHPDDPVRQATRAAVIQAILNLFKLSDQDTVHIPLAVGNHVDHQLVREVGHAICHWRPTITAFYYEDYPYTLQGPTAVNHAVLALDDEMVRTIHAIDDPAIDAKIAAVSRYKSQLSTFWDSENKMAREIRATIQQNKGEAEWRSLLN